MRLGGEGMIDAGWLNVGSLVFGLIAWGVPVMSFIQYRQADVRRCALYAVVSLSACATALGMQMLYTGHLVKISDWTALLDTYEAVIGVSSILLIVTIIMNSIALALYIKKK